MSGIQEQFTRHLSTDGDLGFVTTGTNLYELVRKGGTFKKIYNVNPQQLVMWTGDANCGVSPLTIEPAALVLADLNELHIGSGLDSTGDGMVDVIREISPTEVQGCTFAELDAYGPKCAIPHIKAVYPGCISCETVTAMYRVYDNSTISFSDEPLKAYEERVVSYTPDCATCDGCPTTPTCNEVVCGLVDALNADLVDLDDDGKPYPHTSPKGYGSGATPGVEFVKLHANWFSYCLAPVVGSDCTECNSIAALTNYTINDIEFDFNLIEPGDNTQTLVTQLEAAVDKINATFESELGRHSGKAVLTRGQGSCCPMQIFVSTCDTNFTIAGLTNCSTVIDQFPSFVTDTVCKECGDGVLATKAKQILTSTSTPLDTETVVIGGKTYTFQTVLTDVNGNVLIGGTNAASMDNLEAAINLTGTPGTDYALSMTINPDVTAHSSLNGGGDAIVTVTAKVAGVAGNAITTTETLSTGSWGAVTLAGGAAATAGVEPTCGIAIIAKQDLENCDCDLNQPKQFWGRRVEFDIISPSGAMNPRWSNTATLLEGQMPSNFGSQIQYLEYAQAAGGPGFDYEIGNIRRGWLGQFSKDSKINQAIKAKCDKSYCSYNLGFRGQTEYGPFQNPINLNMRAFIHVPENDAVTKTAMEALLLQILTLVPTGCKVLTAIDCAGDAITQG